MTNLGGFGQNDVVFALSCSGETLGLADMLAYARRFKIIL
jgi:D-arabinose 5-phosphate isomerase GutQ